MPKRKVQNMGSPRSFHGFSTVSPCLCREYKRLHIPAGIVVLLFLKEAGDSRGALVSFSSFFPISFLLFFFFFFLTLGLNKALGSQSVGGLREASVSSAWLYAGKIKCGANRGKKPRKNLVYKSGYVLEVVLSLLFYLPDFSVSFSFYFCTANSSFPTITTYKHRCSLL